MKLVSELSGVLLDYWVARANGYQTDLSRMKPGDGWCAIEPRSSSVADPNPAANPLDVACGIAMVPNAIREFPACILGYKVGRGKYPMRSSWFYPSSLWSHGGPIVEREQIGLMPTFQDGKCYWTAAHAKVNFGVRGDTPLLAAMRVYVGSKFGMLVDADDAIPNDMKVPKL